MLRAVLIKASDSPSLKRHLTLNPVAKRVVSRFVAGDTLDEAAAAVRVLNDRGAAVALDFLGENTTSPHLAAEATRSYIAALDRIEQAQLDANVSVKLTAMGLDLDPDLAAEQAGQVLERAKTVGAMVGVDMESQRYTGPTIDMVERLRSRSKDGSSARAAASPEAPPPAAIRTTCPSSRPERKSSAAMDKDDSPARISPSRTA